MKPRALSIRAILLLTVSTLTLLITLLMIREVAMEWRRLEKIGALKEATFLSDHLFDATEKISVERDIAFSMLHAKDIETIKNLEPRLKESRQASDEAFIIVMNSLTSYAFPELATLRGKIRAHLSGIRDMRGKIDQATLLPKKQQNEALAERWYGEVATLLQQTQDLWVEFVKHFTDINPVVTQHLRFKHFLRVITDYSGRERAVISRLLVENTDPTPEETAQLLRGQGAIELSWQMLDVLADQSGLYPSIASHYTDAKSHYMTMTDMVRDIFYVPGMRHGASYPISVDLWFELSTQANESLDALKDAAFRETRRYVEMLEGEAEQAIVLHTALLALALFIGGYSFRLITHQVIRPINAMVEALVSTMEGKPVSFTSQDNRQDEIGKLAQVLHAFQQNVEELKTYMQALERSNKELDDFAYIASHDLKEPLRGIHNHSRFLLEDNQDKLNEESVKKLNRLLYLSQRMERLVNDLLYFSRLGRQELAIQSTDINEVIQDIENTLELFLAERKARIHVPAPLPTITCDKTRVTELLRNLITNAVKYNDKPEKTVEIGLLPTHASPQGDTYSHVFYVKDDGKGIDQQFHEEIFRIFKRLQSNTDTAEDGTGVGLTFVKKIVERHGGKIWLESNPGRGTTFYFTLEGLHYDTSKAA